MVFIMASRNVTWHDQEPPKIPDTRPQVADPRSADRAPKLNERPFTRSITPPSGRS